MGFFYRKSINLGPFRVNTGKSGLGYSVGGRGFRVGTTSRRNPCENSSRHAHGAWPRRHRAGPAGVGPFAAGSFAAGSFAGGSFAAAIAENVDILPVAVAGSGRMLSKGGFRVRPSKIQVRIGKRISTSGLGQGDRFDLAAKARGAVEELHAGALDGSAVGGAGSAG